MTIDLQYVKRRDIDVARWDDCINNSPNRLIYGYHFYLDHLTGGQWDALISGDYQAVMPLTRRRKYGITYLAQPEFTQQLGIFSPHPQTVAGFLQETQKHFRFAEIFFNYGNPDPALEARTNLILPLNKPYETLVTAYSENHRRNLKKGASLQYTAGISITQENPRFANLCQYLEKKNECILRAVTNDLHQPLATAVLFKDANRLYLIKFAALPAGREKAAGHFLIDRIIKEFAGGSLLLDFEGSDDPGVGRFYSGFGATNQPYYFWRHNALPWPFKLFKPAQPTPPAATPPPAQDLPE
jgi:hypothetical protein